MGLLDFFNKQQNTISDDGLNLIYSKEDGYLLYAFNKSNGIIDGLFQVFYNPKDSGRNPNYKKNKKVGLVYQEYFFSEGKQNGPFKEYHKNGKLSIYRGNLKSDFLDFNNQKWSNLMQTNLIVSDDYEINGNLNIYRFDSGEIKKEKNYDNGRLIYEKWFFPNGNLEYNSLDEKYYYDNGQLKLDKKEGVAYYINGNIKTKPSKGIENSDDLIWYNTDGTIMNEQQIIKRSETEIAGLKVRYNFSPRHIPKYIEETKYLFINRICFFYVVEGSHSIDNSALSVFSGIYKGEEYLNGRKIISNKTLNEYEYFERGIEKYLNSDYEGAIKDYSKAIEINIKYIDAYRERAMAKRWLKDYEGAIIDYTKILDLNSKDIEAIKLRGLTKASLKDYKGAIEDYSKTIELDKESKVYSSRGRMKKYLLDFDGALQDFNIAVEKFPDDYSSYYGRGELKYEIEDYLGAIEDFNKCIKLEPERIMGYHKRGDCKFKIEDYNGAIDDYSIVIQNRQNKYDLGSSSSEAGVKILSKLYHTRGIARSKINKYTDAIKDYNKAVELNPICTDEVNEDLEQTIKQQG